MELFNPQQILPSISNQITGSRAETLVERVQNSSADKSGNDLKSTAQEFESLLLYKMLEAMRRTVPKSGLLNSFSMDMYQSMMDQEVANEIAKKGTVGLSQMLYEQLTKLQSQLNEQATGISMGKSKNGNDYRP
jgi:flagellar protein FlgJ